MTHATLIDEARGKLIVALDVPNIDLANEMIDKLGDSVVFYKIGMELIYHGGLDLAKKLKEQGKKVFIDAKLHDIPRTVLAAARNIEKYEADLLTLHCNSSAYRAFEQYRAESGKSNMKWCFVTVLTSEDDRDLGKMKIRRTAKFHVKELAVEAIKQGADGIVASAQEAESLRKDDDLKNNEFIIITPGIRPEGSSHNDQRRVTTPTNAIQSGSDYLVVGRPIIQADNPKDMAEKIVEEIADALAVKKNIPNNVYTIQRNNTSMLRHEKLLMANA
ncbi:MAG: orotidine-5'-phosphate decarboxylase [Alphaproteobacteria bacterium]|nr:orotidine-5'-phosphate decarboxylase [Alphaproteobacteria bacterium]